jgi:hypothetical protein
MATISCHAEIALAKLTAMEQQQHHPPPTFSPKLSKISFYYIYLMLWNLLTKFFPFELFHRNQDALNFFT